MKICNDLTLSPSINQLSTNLLQIVEILPASKDEDIINTFQTLYQPKVRLLIFASIATCLDIIFAVLKLS